MIREIHQICCLLKAIFPEKKKTEWSSVNFELPLVQASGCILNNSLTIRIVVSLY